jgi:O-antigen/teichoic acid export membrane protein
MLKNGIYITLSGALRALMGIATIPLLIKILGVEEYGLWALIYSTVALVFTIEGGIAIAATFFIARDLEDSKNLAITLTVITAVTAVLAGGAAILTYGGADIVVKFFSTLSTQQADQARQAIQIGAWAISARLFQQVPISLQQATHRYGSLSLLNLLLAALTTLSLVPIAALPPAMVAAFGGRLVAMMAWFAASNVLVLLLHLAIISRWLSSRSLRPQWQTARMIEFLRYCSFTWLSSIGSLLFMRGDRLIVGKILDIKTLGVYAAITDITVQINNLSAFPLQPLLPAISNMWQVSTIEEPAPGKNLKAIRQVVRQGAQTNALVAFSLGAILFYLASQLFLLITSRPPSIEELLCFRIAIVGYTIYSLNAVGYFALFAIGGARTCGLIQLGSGIFALFCIFIGVTYGGLVGAAIGNLGYSVTLLLVVMSMRQMEIPLATWLKWLKLPLIWFSIAVALGILLEGHLVWQYLFLAIQLVILAAWFVMARPVKLHRWR